MKDKKRGRERLTVVEILIGVRVNHAKIDERGNPVMKRGDITHVSYVGHHWRGVRGTHF